MRKFLLILCICTYAMGLNACSREDKATTESLKQDERYKDIDEKDLETEEKEGSNANNSTLALDDTTRELATKENLKLKYGDFYDVYDGNENKQDKNNILILQVLLPEAQDREIVLEQNFLNVEDLIKNQNCSTYDQIEYVAKLKNNSNKKEDIMSFVLDKNCINQISTAAITVEEYEQNVKELWVASLPLEIAGTMNQENDTDVSSQTVTIPDMTPSTESTSISSVDNTSWQDSQNGSTVNESIVPDYIVEENQ